MPSPRITVQVLAVLTVFLGDPGAERFGFQISQASGLAAGTVYPILQRLLDAGWLVERYETPGELGGHQGPLRRYYRLTDEGSTRAYNAVQQRQAQHAGLARVFAPSPASPNAARDGDAATGGAWL